MEIGKKLSIILLGIITTMVAQEMYAKQTVEVNSQQLFIKGQGYNQAGQLKVAGPNGDTQTYKINKGQSVIPFYDLNLQEDGLYEYELSLITEEGEISVTEPSNGRVNAKRTLGKSEKLNGAFTVVNGQIVEGQLENNNQYSDAQK